ncbi:long-chain fatty acid transport protein 6 isoform X2 [Epinephelus fuscoguttatus]|uniref:long-chain fatty acid transport protein 6 isoform X2 n=1 Tax=Epinephelus fuscoguttatus TaxID=293821 RepID=UPI0020D179DF|nr:long-chain fatty acid transport protein 6 isoform X2 [Epinephelus fuscoguttatus]
MIPLMFTSVLAGLLALLLYQRTNYPFFWVDLIYYLKLRKYRRTSQARMQQGIITYLDCFLYQARNNPNKPFIIFENQSLTYQDVDKRSNQFANAFRTVGSLKQGDIVALLMFNEPDFICVWLGLCKLGCEVAFLNVNIKAQSLLHCFHSCGAKTLVVGADLVHLVEEVLPDLKKNNAAVWVVDHTSPSEDFSTLLDKVEHMAGETLSDLPKVDIMSNFLFIFTSGTTGLSKAARVGHLKAIVSMAFFQMCGATSDDIIYITLPLYHMSASLLGIGGCIHLGATCVLKKKFSASQFWKDCLKHNVTVVQYIGELCRYLLNQSVLSMPFELLRYDPQTYEPVRTDSGRCIRAQMGEAGILVAPLTAMNQFLGYAGNQAQSEKKLLRDVFQAGDIYFNTGDLLLHDHRDFLYFRDRIGDTYRWKGENVSTTEVSEVLGLLDFIQEANVYGVTIPGYEGRAGMAAIVLKQDHKCNGPKLYSHLVKTLPAYAWPWFLRIQSSLDVTETFKQQKIKLVQEGFNPDVTQDLLYFLDVSQKDYILLTVCLYDDIVSGKIKL